MNISNQTGRMQKQKYLKGVEHGEKHSTAKQRQMIQHQARVRRRGSNTTQIRADRRKHSHHQQIAPNQPRVE
jgi:hypothetical protein